MRAARSRKGFSLIELIIVISIIAMLAGVVTPKLSSRMLQARDARRLSDVQTVRGAIEQYYQDKGVYPVANQNGGYGGWDVSHDGNFITALVEEGYLSEMVVDPINDDTYHFRYYVYNNGSYGCVGPEKFYVLGIRNFESTKFVTENSGYFDCTGRNWGNEFDWVTGGGASKR